ncbi:hypothetical protein BC941DRAFT_192367 [Chlamydoabsidia padenii]|nr:hypothetical protein BC941DRAFT_192367 [Chlamydoabsidia padenii]
MDYRCGIIKKAEQQQCLTITKLMALNFIFLVNIDKSNPAFLSRQEWNHITLSMIKMKPIVELSKSTKTFVQKFARAARMSTSLALDTLNDFTLDEITATKKFIRMLLTNLAQKYDGLRVDNMNEDTFVKYQVDPIMAAQLPWQTWKHQEKV